MNPLRRKGLPNRKDDKFKASEKKHSEDMGNTRLQFKETENYKLDLSFCRL